MGQQQEDFRWSACTGHSQAVGIEDVYSGREAHPKEQLSRQRAEFFISAALSTQVHSKRCPLGKHASGNECCPHAVMEGEASAKLTQVSVPL